MFTFFITVIIIVSLLLVGLVMLQNSQKDGGNSMANELGGLHLMGVQQTNKTLTDSTITLIFVLFVNCFLSNKVLKKSKNRDNYNISKDLINTETTLNNESSNNNSDAVSKDATKDVTETTNDNTEKTAKNTNENTKS